jgi:butyrate kinase
VTRNQFVILTINPGSTHDEVVLFKGDEEIFKKKIKYSLEDLKPFEEQNVASQYDFRKGLIKQALKEEGVDLNNIDAVVGRGGLLHPIPGGVFKVNEDMVDDLMSAKYGDHPSNLGGMIAYAIGKAFNKPAFIADSVVTDEMSELAHYTGLPEIKRRSVFHCLNQKRVGYLAANKLGKTYKECNLIIMHGGGGITIGAHKQGKVVDVNSGLDGEGPFTPQRSGFLPVLDVVKMVLNDKLTYDDVKVKTTRRGGLRAHLGTSDLIAIDDYIAGRSLPEGHHLDTQNNTPEKVREVLEAMCYFISKEICSLTAVFNGKVDAIVLTGGIAYDDEFCVPWILERIEWIAPVFIFPGGDEMRALKNQVELVLSGEEKARDYEAWKD